MPSTTMTMQDPPIRAQDRDTGRWYVIIGWAPHRLTGVPYPITIPETISPVEPTRHDQARDQVLIPEDM